MTAAELSRSPADELAAALRRAASPDSLIDARLAIARAVAAEAVRAEPVSAALVAGSTALRRCSASADLDILLLTPGPGERPAFESRKLSGVQVEVERVTEAEALAATEGEGWIWELRQAARLATGVPVYDPDGFAARLSGRAAAMRPDPEQYDSTLRGVYLSIAEVNRVEGGALARGEIVRGCLDNLVVLTLLDRPRRYQKAKWALADLLHAGETELVDAALGAYGAIDDGASSVKSALAAARALVEASLQHTGAPTYAPLLAMGYAPQFSEASYVARCLADAEDLARSGRGLEAQYVARFAARLAASLVSASHVEASIRDSFDQASPVLASLYADNFDHLPEPSPTTVGAVLFAADACARRLDAAGPAA